MPVENQVGDDDAAAVGEPAADRRCNARLPRPLGPEGADIADGVEHAPGLLVGRPVEPAREVDEPGKRSPAGIAILQAVDAEHGVARETPTGQYGQASRLSPVKGHQQRREEQKIDDDPQDDHHRDH